MVPAINEKTARPLVPSCGAGLSCNHFWCSPETDFIPIYSTSSPSPSPSLVLRLTLLSAIAFFPPLVITDVHIIACVLENFCQFVGCREGTIVLNFMETIEWDLQIQSQEFSDWGLRSEGPHPLQNWTF